MRTWKIGSPDWVYRPAEQRFTWRCLQTSAANRVGHRSFADIGVASVRTTSYLNHALNRSAVCFLASWRQTPVAFSAWLPFLGQGPKARREHRTVTLPDFQGVGMGNAPE